MEEEGFTDTPEPTTYKMKAAVSLNPYVSPAGVIESVVNCLSDQFDTDPSCVDVKAVEYRNVETKSLVEFNIGPLQTKSSLEEIEDMVEGAFAGSEIMTSKHSKATVVSTIP